MPSDAQQEKKPDLGRRGFLVALGGAWATLVGALLFPIYKYLKPTKLFDPFSDGGKAKVKDLSPEDVAKPGMGGNGGYASRGVIIYRNQEKKLVALDARCTHAGCIVTYKQDKIVCHCHGGVYNLQGKNVSGPPPRPLTPLKVIEEDGALYVMKFNS